MPFQLLHKTLLIFLFIFCFSISISFSQQTSEVKEAQKTYDSLKVAWKDKSYEELVSFFVEGNSTTNSIQMQAAADLLLRNAKNNNENKYFVTAYHYLAAIHYFKDEYNDAIYDIDKAIKYLKIVKEYRDDSGIYLVKGAVHQAIAQHDKAMDCYLIGLDLAKKKKAEIIKITFKTRIALLRNILHDTKGALDMYFDILKSIKGNENLEKYYLFSVLIGIAKAYSDMGNYEKGLMYCYEGLEIATAKEDKKLTFLGIANIYSLTGKYLESLEFLEKAKKITGLESEDYLNSYLHLYTARTNYFLGLYNKIIPELIIVESLKTKNKFDFYEYEEMYILYAKTYQKLGNAEKAKYYYNKTLEVFKYNDQRKARLNNKIIERYDLGSLKTEIETISTTTKQRKYIIRIILIISIVLIISFFLFYQNLKAKNKNRFNDLLIQLKMKNDELLKEKSLTRVDDEKINELLGKLRVFEKEKNYLDRNITLSSLAKKLATNTSYLSKTINIYKKQNFIAYLTELRINYVLQTLKEDVKLRSYTIESIAQEIGFNNVSTFVKAFKAKTRIYPSYYIKKLNKETA